MDRLALVCEEIASHASRLKKVAILADYFRTLEDRDLELAVQFLSAGPALEGVVNHSLFELEEKTRLSIGHSVLRDAVQVASGWDLETLRVCHAEVGDMGETTGLLLRGISEPRPFTLQAANEVYQQLFRARATARKRDLLVTTYRQTEALTVKYFVKVITRGLRIGLMARQVEEAIALACDVPAEAVRDAANRLGDLARVALAARHGELSAIEARLFHPMEFMLAKPLENLEDLPSPADWIIEDKYDGIRSQVHYQSGYARIYSRGMEEVTFAFPELKRAFEALGGNGLIDGEILAWRDGRALNFNVLQQRLARKNVRATLMAEVPVVFMGYDMLLHNDRLLLHAPIEERRQMLLETIGGEPSPILLSPQLQASDHEGIDRLFTRGARTRKRGFIAETAGQRLRTRETWRRLAEAEEAVWDTGRRHYIRRTRERPPGNGVLGLHVRCALSAGIRQCRQGVQRTD